MRTYLTTDEVIANILRFQKQKKAMRKNPFNRVFKRKELKRFDHVIAGNFQWLHEVYPEMSNIDDIQVFKKLNDDDMLTKYSKNATIGAPKTVLSEAKFRNDYISCFV